jgi:hypothetical protein
MLLIPRHLIRDVLAIRHDWCPTGWHPIWRAVCRVLSRPNHNSATGQETNRSDTAAAFFFAHNKPHKATVSQSVFNHVRPTCFYLPEKIHAAIMEWRKGTNFDTRLVWQPLPTLAGV